MQHDKSNMLIGQMLELPTSLPKPLHSPTFTMCSEWRTPVSAGGLETLGTQRDYPGKRHFRAPVTMGFKERPCSSVFRGSCGWILLT